MSETNQTAEHAPIHPALSPKQLDVLLEGYDLTDTKLQREIVGAFASETVWLRLKAKGRRLELEELRKYAGELIDPDGDHDILCCAIVYFKDLKEAAQC